MANFLLVPTNCEKNIFKVGALLYLVSQKITQKVIYKRVIQSKSLNEEEILLERQLNIDNSDSIRLSVIDTALSLGLINDLSEKIAAYFYSDAIRSQDIVWVEGILPDNERAYLFDRNRSIACTLKAEIIFLVDAKDKDAKRIVEFIKIFNDVCFVADTKKLGFILFNVQTNIKEYIEDVKHYMSKVKMDLRCLLALDHDLSDVNTIKQFENLAKLVDDSIIRDALKHPVDMRMAPPVYRKTVIERASKAKKRIVLPEGNEPRTIEAAVICHEKGIARCVLLADKKEVENVVQTLNLTLPSDIEIINPSEISEQYVFSLMEIRKNKGLSEEEARELLKDSVFVGTMMLKLGEVDGLVSGAVHTTANTIRPALQIIKTDPNSTMVSSIFFMLMPNEVYVFGDCAVNTELSAEQLAEVAIQSNDSAIAFGIEPRVAMISFSTKNSGSGLSVDKVRQATMIVKSKRPDILIDGPLQYDAACVTSVAEKKAPGSPVAGYANVFIFPDLNTGNTVYKAVQRTGNILSVGPMLQGLNKPVNDLSRGASIDDIVFTIAITAIQAVQKNIH